MTFLAFLITLPFWPALIYILAAVLPAVYLLRYIYRHDTVEPEPPGLLFSLLLLGILAALASGFLEGVGERILRRHMAEYHPLYTILFAFLVVAAVEEGTKFLLLKWRTWRHPAFNFRFDGVVYAAFVSLGFAAFENIQYIFSYGLSVALPRAVLALPGHMSFSIFMGVFYGKAKVLEHKRYPALSTLCLLAVYLSAVFLHGMYDACAMIGTPHSIALFLFFVLFMFAGAFRMLKRESAADAPV